MTEKDIKKGLRFKMVDKYHHWYEEGYRKLFESEDYREVYDIYYYTKDGKDYGKVWYKIHYKDGRVSVSDYNLDELPYLVNNGDAALL